MSGAAHGRLACDVLHNPPPLKAKQNQDENAEERLAGEMAKLTSKKLDDY